jgi:hypothetical protein
MSVIDRRRGPRYNRILQALPAEDRDRLIRNMVPVSLPIKTVLFEPGEPIRAVNFPLGGVTSHGSTKPLIVGFLTRMIEIVAPLRSSVAA